MNWLKVTGAVLLCLMCGGGIVLRAAPPSVPKQSPATTTTKQAPTRTTSATGKRHALLVGVNSYQHPKLGALQFAENDAQEMAALLKKQGYAVTLLVGTAASKRGIETGLRDIVAKCAKGDTILVGLAGHGLQFLGVADSYFCPVDGRPFKDQTESLVSLGMVYRELDQSFAGMKVLLVDACRDDPSTTRGIDADTAPKPPQGVAALFSCRAGERAFEHKNFKHGVFFHYVLEGLKGEAQDRDGEVTFASLSGYVTKNVSRNIGDLIGGGARQSPNMKADYSSEPVLVTARGGSIGEGWEYQLTGDTIRGWKAIGADVWTLKQGVLSVTTPVVAGRKSNGFLLSEKSYTNYEIDFEFQFGPNANSGIFLYAYDNGKEFGGGGFHEIQINDDHAMFTPPLRPEHMTGSLYNAVAAAPLLKPKANSLHHMNIAVFSKHVRVILDGKKVLESELPLGKPTSGGIGIQQNGGTNYFRSIRIRELNSDGTVR